MRHSETDDPGILMHVWGTFALAVVKVILGSLGELISIWPATRKLCVEIAIQTTVTFGTRGPFITNRGYL